MTDAFEVVRALQRARGITATTRQLAVMMDRPVTAVRKAITQLRDEGRVEAVDVVVVTVADRNMTTRGYQLTQKGRRK